MYIFIYTCIHTEEEDLLNKLRIAIPVLMLAAISLSPPPPPLWYASSSLSIKLPLLFAHLRPLILPFVRSHSETHNKVTPKDCLAKNQIESGSPIYIGWRRHVLSRCGDAPHDGPGDHVRVWKMSVVVDDVRWLACRRVVTLLNALGHSSCLCV